MRQVNDTQQIVYILVYLNFTVTHGQSHLVSNIYRKGEKYLILDYIQDMSNALAQWEISLIDQY